MTKIKDDNRVYRKVTEVQVEEAPKPEPKPKETKPKKAATRGKKSAPKS
jgi:hypothetical protein